MGSGTGPVFDLILADCPWRYAHSRSKKRAIERKYRTMTQKDIEALPVQELVAPDGAVLFMWATFPKLREALRTIEAWGFTYKTGEPWLKYYGTRRKGMGYYTRLRDELLLIATCGKAGPPPEDRRPDSGLYGGYTEHSRKPESQYDQIEFMYPEKTKIELFARAPFRKGWSVWGLETGLRILSTDHSVSIADSWPMSASTDPKR